MRFLQRFFRRKLLGVKFESRSQNLFFLFFKAARVSFRTNKVSKIFSFDLFSQAFLFSSFILPVMQEDKR